MKIKFLGHAAFVITSKKGTRIITDPYKAGAYDGGIGYSEITETADIVTISHEHDDHNYTASIKGQPVIVKDPGETKVKDIKIKGLATHHDKSQGSERGTNNIFVMDIDGFKLLHLGDLGHTLGQQEAKEIGQVDILLAPVGGYFTIDATEAREIYELLKPAIMIPMHYKTSKCGFPISPVGDFADKMKNVRKVDGSEVDISELPASPTIYVLDPIK